MKRRDLLKAASATLGLSAFPLGWVAAAESKTKKVLYFTRSAGFEHSVVHRKDGQLAHSEKILTEMGKAAGFDVECTQDGGVFDGNLDQYDAIAFFTSGNLISPKGNGKPMSAAGKQRLLDAVHAGKGFIGFHACTDSFRPSPPPPAPVEPYLAMVGAEFVGHGAQQEVPLGIVSHFPGTASLGSSDTVSFKDEWYAQKNFGKDLHVILVQRTAKMEGGVYRRPDFPCTWARLHGKGRVFYTSLGHREDIWTNPRFQSIALGGIAWTLGNVAFDPVPNVDSVTPGANQLKS